MPEYSVADGVIVDTEAGVVAVICTTQITNYDKIPQTTTNTCATRARQVSEFILLEIQT